MISRGGGVVSRLHLVTVLMEANVIFLKKTLNSPEQTSRIHYEYFR